MPNVCTLTSEDKQTIKKCIPKPSNKIITAAVARLYVAHPNPNQWRFTGISGAVVFAYDMVGNTLFFKMVDISHSNRGIIWDQELYENFKYHQDRTFFHSFELEECMAGLSFANVNEASVFYRRVNERLNAMSNKNVSSAGGLGPSGFSKAGIKKKVVDKSKIGAPLHFQHISHIGWDSEKGFTVENIDPSWQKFFHDLGQYGVSSEQIEQNKEFIREYVTRNGGLGSINQVSETSVPSTSNVSTSQESTKKLRSFPPPPPPIPSSSNAFSGSSFIRRAPPPPPPRKINVSAPEASQSSDSTRRPPEPPRNSANHLFQAPIKSVASTDNSSTKLVAKLSHNEKSNCDSTPPSVLKSIPLDNLTESTTERPTSLPSLKPDILTSSVNKSRRVFSSNTPVSSKNSQTRSSSEAIVPNISSGSSSLSQSVLPPPVPPPLPPMLSAPILNGSTPLVSSEKSTEPSSLQTQNKNAQTFQDDTSIPQIPNLSCQIPRDIDRSNLMASIRASGGVSKLRKTEPSLSSRSSVGCHNESSCAPSGTSEFINLEDALAAVLKDRKGKVTLSDDEESEDDSWDN